MPPMHGVQQSQNKKMLEMANIRQNAPRSLDKYAHEYHQAHGQKIAMMGGVPNNHNYMHPSNQTVGHLESISQRVGNNRHKEQELRAQNGNIIAFTGRPLENINDRYVNPKIEEELKDFKKEIEEKYAKSRLKNYNFPLKKQMPKLPNANIRSARYD